MTGPPRDAPGPERRTLSGPAVPPHSGGEARQLVVFLHGWGSSGDDLIQLAPFFARALPDARFVAPNGPERCDANPAGFQWFPLAGGGAEREEGARRARADIDAFLDSDLGSLGLGPEALALVGFSQGAMMALDAGLARPPAGIAAYSGALLPSAAARGEADVLLVHGGADDVVPVEGLYDAVARLGPMGARVRFHVRPGLGHSIDPDGIELGAEFLRRRLLAA